MIVSSRIKKWDLGTLIPSKQIYNLEDKVDLEGVGNDKILKIMIVLFCNKLG